MKVLLLGPWNRRCGIAEYGRLLVETTEEVDPALQLIPEPVLIDCTEATLRAFDVVHLNHSQGTQRGEDLRLVSRAQALGIPCVITQHDTFETFSIMQERGFPDFRSAAALVVHEPVAGLSERPAVHTWRQGIPAPQPTAPLVLLQGDEILPVLGTIGFPYPWKQYDLLAEGTRAAGWGLYLLAAGAAEDQIARWRTINPDTWVEPHFLPTPQIVSRLTGCTATAFLYAGAGSGTSGALRCGIAARRPVLVTACRQFRDLLEDPEAVQALAVIPGTVQGLVDGLSGAYQTPKAPEVERLADRDAWTVLGARYAQLYRSLAGGSR